MFPANRKLGSVPVSAVFIHGDRGCDDVFFAADALGVLTWASGVSVAFINRSQVDERFQYGTQKM
jgi:hypothetical protein